MVSHTASPPWLPLLLRGYPYRSMLAPKALRAMEIIPIIMLSAMVLWAFDIVLYV
jgi:hypothetical protein